MAHILFVYKQFPAPSVGHAGGESLFRMMRALYDRGHQVSLVARITDEEQRYFPAVKEICSHVLTVQHHKSIVGPIWLIWPSSYISLRRAARYAIRNWNPDLLHVETTQTALALIGISRPPASYRTQDVNWFLEEQRLKYTTGLARILTQVKKIFFRALEQYVCNKYDLLLAISLGDRALLAPVCKHTELILLPLSPALNANVDIPPAVLYSKTVVFVGAMSRDHNISGVKWFLDEIWPKIRNKDSQARFYIVGANPPNEIIERTTRDESITVTGYVDDLTPWYKAATIFVSPLRIAGGLLQKILDAMTMGVPVVATSPCNHGISARDQSEIVIADSPSDFALRVVELLNNPQKRAQIGLAGQEFVATKYGAEKSIDRWESALLALLPAKSGSE